MGDLVVNLGYLPSDDELDSDENPEAMWFVMDGQRRLVPFRNGMGRAPCPTYYSHILGTGVNPQHVLSLPSSSSHKPSMDLVRITSCVSSTAGRMRVGQFVWLARVAVGRADSGWEGEWVVEVEGTPEGRRMLESALEGGKEAVWEVVLEKCGEGSIWLKCVLFLFSF